MKKRFQILLLLCYGYLLAQINTVRSVYFELDKFSLKPIYIIANVRKNSPAALSGLQKEDVIVRINGKPGYEFTLERINALLKSEDEDWITFEVERESQIMKFQFQLLNVL